MIWKRLLDGALLKDHFLAPQEHLIPQVLRNPEPGDGNPLRKALPGQAAWARNGKLSH